MEQEFPDVVVATIFTFLDGLSLLQASQVNKQWNTLAESDKLWRMMCLKRWTFCSFSDDYLGTRTWKQFFLYHVKEEHRLALAEPEDFSYKISQDMGIIRSIAYVSGSGFSMNDQEKSIICGISSINRLFAWDVQMGNVIWVSPAEQSSISFMITLPQKHLVFTLDSTHTVKVWNCSERDALAAVTMPKHCLSMETFITEHGSFLAVGDCEGNIYTFTVPDLRSISRVHAFNYNVEHLLCSPDKKLMFASGYEEFIFPKVISTEHLLKPPEDNILPLSIPIPLCWTACWALRKANRIIATFGKDFKKKIRCITFDFTIRWLNGQILMQAPNLAGINDGNTVLFASNLHLLLYTIDGALVQKLEDHHRNICHICVGPVYVLTTAMDDSMNLYVWEEKGSFPYLRKCCSLQQVPGDWTPSCFTSKAICDNRTIACVASRNRDSSTLVMYSLKQ